MPFASTKDILVKAIQELAERKNPIKPNRKSESVEAVPMKQPPAATATETVSAKIQALPIKVQMKVKLETDATRLSQQNNPDKNINKSNVAPKESGGQGANKKYRAAAKVINPLSRHIPAEIKRIVWHKHQGKCCFKNPTTGRICGSQKFAQVDHIFPFSRGGAHTISNLQLLCGAHNRHKGSSFL